MEQSGQESIASLYDRLMKKFQTDKPKVYDLQERSSFINTLLKPTATPDPDTLMVAKIIYLLIHYHSAVIDRRMDTSTIPYKGKNITKGVCPKFEMRNLPPNLRGVLMKFIDEVTEN